MATEYLRDGRAPVPKKESTSRVMRANKAKNTKPEIKLRKALWHAGHKGYRLHSKDIPGRPDIIYGKHELAIFVNGCYWHRCDKCEPSFPRSNQHFWREKFRKNKERDKRKIDELEAQGWRTITIWECEIKKELSTCIRKISELMND
ncbi:MAG: very short patch repair endonuclease [Melioribacteraceae bacterium]|nr:very short patch repair endonuclease [Melioribacteraceae bacterium]